MDESNRPTAQRLVEWVVRHWVERGKGLVSVERRGVGSRGGRALRGALLPYSCLAALVVVLIRRKGHFGDGSERMVSRMVLARTAKASAGRMAQRALVLAAVMGPRLARTTAGAGQQQAEQENHQNEFGDSLHIQATEPPGFRSVDSNREARCQPLLLSGQLHGAFLPGTLSNRYAEPNTKGGSFQWASS